MFDYNEILQQLPLEQLAEQVGASPAEVQNAARHALPALLMGMEANAQDPAGEALLASALGGHDPSLLEGGINLDRIDTGDGAKITRNIFGANQDQVVNQLGGMGSGNGLIQKLLPMLAPIVMAWLAGKLMKSDERQGDPAPQQPSGRGGGGLGDILGQILGGGAAAPQPQTQPQTQNEPQFRAPDAGAGQQLPTPDAAPRMPMPEPEPRAEQPQQPGGGGFGGGILGDLLGGLLGGGRR